MPSGPWSADSPSAAQRLGGWRRIPVRPNQLLLTFYVGGEDKGLARGVAEYLYQSSCPLLRLVRRLKWPKAFALAVDPPSLSAVEDNKPAGRHRGQLQMGEAVGQPRAISIASQSTRTRWATVQSVADRGGTASGNADFSR